MPRNHGWAGVVAAVLLLAPALPAHAAEGAALCQEDAAEGAPPTYTQRFDPRDGEGGESAFTRARERAMRFCAQKICTVGGSSATRKASVYGVGTVVRGRLIVGFNCLPPAAASGPVPEAARYPLDKPSDIDDAAAKAREHCAAGHAKAELVDLVPEGDRLVAVFGCGP